MSFSYSIHDAPALANGITKVVNIYECTHNNSITACQSNDITTSNGLVIGNTTSGNLTVYTATIPIVQNGVLHEVNSTCPCNVSNLQTIEIIVYGISTSPALTIEIHGSIGTYINNYTIQITIEVIDNTVLIDETNITILFDDNTVKPYTYSWLMMDLQACISSSMVKRWLLENNNRAVRYTNSYSDLRSNNDRVPFIAIQDRFFVAGNNNSRSDVQTKTPYPLTMSGWTNQNSKLFISEIYTELNANTSTTNINTDVIEGIPVAAYNLMPYVFWRTGQVYITKINDTSSFKRWTSNSFFHDYGMLTIKYQDRVLKALTPNIYHDISIKRDSSNQPIGLRVHFYYFDNYQSPHLSYTCELSPDNFSALHGGSIAIIPIDYNVCMLLYGGSMDFIRKTISNSELIFISNADESILYFYVIHFEQISNQVRVYSKDTLLSKAFIQEGNHDKLLTAGGGLLGIAMTKAEEDTIKFYHLFPWYKVLQTYDVDDNNRLIYPRFDSYYAYVL